MATHSSVLNWRIPGTGEPGGQSSMGLHRVGHNCSDLAAAGCGTHDLSIILNVFRKKMLLLFVRTCNIILDIYIYKHYIYTCTSTTYRNTYIYFIFICNHVLLHRVKRNMKKEKTTRLMRTYCELLLSYHCTYYILQYAFYK